MKNNENQLKTMKINEKAMKINEKQWKSMKNQWKNNEKQWKTMKNNENRPFLSAKEGGHNGRSDRAVSGRVGPCRAVSGRAGSGRKRKIVTDPVPNAPRKKYAVRGYPTPHSD